MKAGRHLLTNDERIVLKEAVVENISLPSHKAYIKSMLATANPLNLRTMYEGFQSIPQLNKQGEYEIRMWKNKGTYQTPRFRKHYEEKYFKEDKGYKVVLEYPKQIKEKIGSGFLVIKLDVDTREEDDWIEEVKIKGIHRSMKYKLIKDKKTWKDAEAHCMGEGGHLASVMTEAEEKDVIAVTLRTGVWIGGNNYEKPRVFGWSDGTPWKRKGWNIHQRESRDGAKCLALQLNIRMLKMEWIEKKCIDTRPFVCQLVPRTLRGNRSLTLTYSKEQIGEDFEVTYIYKASSQKVLDSKEDKRMTGFQLDWRIENTHPPMKISTTQIGWSVKTPGFGENFDQERYLSDQVYKSTFYLPKISAVSGSLVIEVEVETKEGDHEVVEFVEGSRYTFVKEKKTWAQADDHCKKKGGHLASVLTEQENQEVQAVAQGNRVWIGGSDHKEEGVWRWADGSSLSYTSWGDSQGSSGELFNCISMDERGQWDDYTWRGVVIEDCKAGKPSVCQQDPQKRFLNSSLTLRYPMENLSIYSVEVKYVYKAPSQELLDSWKDKNMTGYQLSWFLQDRNGSRPTKKMTELYWQPEAPIPRFQEQYLIKMVKLASRARANNVTREEAINVALKEKEKQITMSRKHPWNSINYKIMCLRGQMKKIYYSKAFQGMNLQSFGDASDNETTDEDIKTGFMLFSVIVYCSEPVALSQFLHSILSTQSPRTIIQATVNTIQSDNINERMTKSLLNDFYLSLDKVFHFQLGKILLATSSSSQLASMMAKDWPYFKPYSQDIGQCLNKTNCQVFRDLLGSLGKYYCK